jgi:hypothetical protein
MRGWAADELCHLDLGDARRTRRLIQTVETLATQPETSVPQAAGSWAQTKAIYRLWSNPAVEPAAIRAAHYQRTAERALGQPLLLAVQDTTDLDLRHHPATTGVGALGSGQGRGLKVHSTLAVTPAGVPVGLLDQQLWARDPAQTGIRQRRRQRPTTAKESGRWLTALTAVEQRLAAEQPVLLVADREADLFDLFAQARRPGSELLIRLAQNRRVTHAAHLLEPAMAQAPLLGEVTVAVGRRAERPPEAVRLQVQAQTLTLEPPRNRSDQRDLSPVTVQVIVAVEPQPPAGVAPLRWLLLTTLPVDELADAERCLEYYSRRWLIERYHYVLKQGCRIEELQLKTAERIERALATYSLVAWRLLWLTYQARQTPEAPCTLALSTAQWQALYASVQRTAVMPDQLPTLGETVRWIAQLGGFLGRRRDGEPGVVVLWRGWRRLEDLTAMWEILHATDSSPPSHDVGKA